MHVLSIVVPTYNRNQVLYKNLSILLGIVEKYGINVYVLDNASPNPISDKIQEFQERYGCDKIKVISNRFNIGGNANIPMAVQFADSEYVWILGDDDVPCSDCIDNILSTINRHPNALLYNFDSCQLGSSVNYVTEGRIEFLEKMGPINKIMFISDCVWNVSRLGENLRFSFFYQNSCAPLLCGLLPSFHNADAVVFSKEKLVEYSSHESSIDTHLSVIPLALGLPAIRTLPLDICSLKLVDRAIKNAVRDWVKPLAVIHQLFIRSLNDDKWDECYFMYSIMLNNIFSLRYTGVTFPFLYLIKFSFLFPKTIRFVYPRIYKTLLKKELELSGKPSVNSL